MKEISNIINRLDGNINKTNEEKVEFKKEIINEQKVTFRLLELSIKNDTIILDEEIQTIYSKLINVDF